MDLTIEDLRCELEKRGLDPEGEIQDLRLRFEQALEKENEQDDSLETNEMDTSNEKPEESKDTTDKKEKEEQEEAKVTIKERKEEDMVTNEGDVEKEKEKSENSEVQSLPPSSSAKETGTDEKDSIDPTPAGDTTTPQEKTTENNDAVTTGDDNSKAETKDITKNPPATKGEENESLIVLVDDTQNDLDADLLAKEKAKGKSGAAGGSKACPPEGGGAKSKEDGDKGDKAEVKTEKKADEKKDDKDGKVKSPTTTPRGKTAKNAPSAANQGSCNLWISGLDNNTKAAQLKGIFSKYGKVVSAKVVTNARNPGAKCFCFLTMSTPEEAAKCIQHLNQTKINHLTVTVKSSRQNENEQNKSSKTNQKETPKEKPESKDTTTDKKEGKPVQEAKVTIKERKEEDMVTNEGDVEKEKEKSENSEVQSLPPSSSAKETGTDEKKDSIDPTPVGDTTTPQEKTTENNDAVTTGDDNSKGETKDSTGNPLATKGEENESLIVLVDDTQNDLDADLLAKEKAKGKSGAAGGSKACPSEGGGAKSKEDGDKGDKAEVKTEKKADEKKDDKDGKVKSATTTPRGKVPKNASGAANQGSCNLWISGLSSTTKAIHVKGIFSKYGKVIIAKLVTNARSPGSKCFCFLTMASVEEATKCIQHLNQTKINRQTVTVKSAKTTPGLMPLKKVAKPGAPKTPVKTDASKSEAKFPAKKSAEKKVTEKKPEGTSPSKKPLDKSPEKKPVGGKSLDKKPVEKKDGKSQPEKGDSNPKRSARSSLDRSKLLSPSKNRTPSKTSSHSPRRNDRPKHHRSGEHSDRMERDFKLTLELKQRKTYLEREVRRQERQIDHARLVELELQRRQKEEAYRLERVREELRMEKEKLERERVKLERAEQSHLWKERQQADMFNGFERERHAVKRPYDRKAAHNDSYWDEPKRPNVGGSSASASRFNRSSFNDETWFNDHKDNYERRGGGSGGDPYYNRESSNKQPMESVNRFSDSNLGRMNHSPQRAGHERYGPPESSSRLSDHVSSDNRFERRDVSSVSYHGHDTDHRNLSADRGREIDRRNVSAHERLGRIRNQPVGGSTWKSDNWSHSHGGLDTGHQWSSNNMNQNYERGNAVGGSGGFVSGGGSSNSGLAQNAGMGNMYGNTMGQQSSMMAGGGGGGGSSSGGGGGNNMGSRMQEPRFDAYKNMEHGGMRRY